MTISLIRPRAARPALRRLRAPLGARLGEVVDARLDPRLQLLTIGSRFPGDPGRTAARRRAAGIIGVTRPPSGPPAPGRTN
ncbi:hypothetical protein [Nonomuraea sp. SBT364]|uniref:hypothetical protein n=1 Tax=Nonomuraea sp. SBT364 TaxID=1580530 RepID=UPI000A779081|nr:hypothetical protein [Nonomuraea sp. SBT364]